ncbi:MAG: FAD-dependent oxidoreductase [Burkholderiales bacterium]|nr:FAD-dependent oxidoreductase [Burkholderiales bacterium]
MVRARRRFIASAAACAAALAGGCAVTPRSPKSLGRVMIIGAGYGGATAAKYLRLWSRGAIEVMLVDREPMFVSCPGSNLVLGGSRSIAELSRSRNHLREYGIQVLNDHVTAVDPVKRIVKFRDRYADLGYERLIVAPGTDFDFEAVPGLRDPEARRRVPQAWRAGPQTLALRRQLESMRDGGVFVLSIPLSPFRCPSAPYERVCQVAHYFRQAKPRSKLVVLDANEGIQSKSALFLAAWNRLYKGMIEYRPNSEVRDVDARTMTVRTDFENVRGDVLNVLPPMRAADVARSTGLVNANGRWCGVDWRSMESTALKGVHVLGDAVLSAPAMPKSGHVANQHGKLAAAAIVEILNGRAPDPSPVITSACYSFVSDREAIHVASVHRYDPKQATLVAVPGSGGVSARPSEIEGVYAWSWAQNIWNDMLG